MNNWIIALIHSCQDAGMDRVMTALFISRILGNKNWDFRIGFKMIQEVWRYE